MLTVFLSFILVFLTLISTSFHLTNISLAFLLLIFVFRKKDYLVLILVEVVSLTVFSSANLGVNLFMVSMITLLYLFGQENILPKRKTSSLLLLPVMVVIWEIFNNLI